MKKVQGKPLPLGVTITTEEINFSVAVPAGKCCQLLLYKAGEENVFETFEMEKSVGEVHCLTLTDINPSEYEYNYLIDEVVTVDPYVKALAGKSAWGVARDVQKHEVRGVLSRCAYHWEGDKMPGIPYHEVVAYSLHVRGFTKHSSSGVKAKGTFRGIAEKIPYLRELGINQIQCMPVYEFEECFTYSNYWGYGKGFWFAPKSAYAASGDGTVELKSMVKECHKAGIEVVLEMPFDGHTSQLMIEECLRYYVMEYHVDGFVLNPFTAPMDSISADPFLKNVKLMKHGQEFQTVMRRFLKGDEGMVSDVMYRLRHHSKEEGILNNMTAHSGFTLHDLVSYDGKHNEANGENNQDGTDYNYSWNCGAEGPSRKKAVLELRKGQVRNAFFLLLLSQGTPCILAGDEFGNTQKGNNNVYCQDNPTGWVNWSGLKQSAELFCFVKDLIAFRKLHPLFMPKEELRGMDCIGCGVPDVSYHGESAWRIPSEVSSRQLGVYYYGAYALDDDCFVAYNMHWLKHSFALPALPKGKEWYWAAATKEGILGTPKLLKNQRMLELEERTIVVAVGR